MKHSYDNIDKNQIANNTFCTFSTLTYRWAYVSIFGPNTTRFVTKRTIIIITMSALRVIVQIFHVNGNCLNVLLGHRLPDSYSDSQVGHARRAVKLSKNVKINFAHVSTTNNDYSLLIYIFDNRTSISILVKSKFEGASCNREHVRERHLLSLNHSINRWRGVPNTGLIIFHVLPPLKICRKQQKTVDEK